jgi:hypothetical protein
MKTDWRSYNHVTEVYARVAEVTYFARPAQDLYRLEPAPGSRLLDAGAGSAWRLLLSRLPLWAGAEWSLV